MQPARRNISIAATIIVLSHVFEETGCEILRRGCVILSPSVIVLYGITLDPPPSSHNVSENIINCITPMLHTNGPYIAEQEYGVSSPPVGCGTALDPATSSHNVSENIKAFLASMLNTNDPYIAGQ